MYTYDNVKVPKCIVVIMYVFGSGLYPGVISISVVIHISFVNLEVDVWQHIEGYGS